LGFYLTWGKRGESISLYEEGILVRARSSEIPWPWEEIGSIRSAVSQRYILGIYTGTERSYTLVRKDGQPLVLDENIQKVDRLAEAIREKIVPMQYARYAPAFEEGRELQFGPVQLSRVSGVVVQQKTLPWGQVRQVSIEKGALRLAIMDAKGHAAEIKIPVEQIPNPEVLLALLQGCAGSEAPV
jgi:hypothetical protein